MAELWGVYEGLKLARELGIQFLEVQLDSLVVVGSITGSGIGSTAGWSLLQNIKELLQLDWEVNVSHVFREANRVADGLANLGCICNGLRIFLEGPPHT